MLSHMHADCALLSSLRGKRILHKNNDSIYTSIWKTKIIPSGKQLVFKEFVDPDTTIAQNSISTLLEIAKYTELREIPELVLPEQLVILDGKCIGYTMEYIEGRNLSNFLRSADPVQALRLFDSLKKVLERANTLPFAFFVSDLHEENVLVCDKTEHLRLIDVDSFFIQGQANHPSRYPSLMRDVLRQYPRKYPLDACSNFCASAELDTFCLLNIAINYIAQTDFYISSLPWNEIADYVSYLSKFYFLRSFSRAFLSICSTRKNRYREIDPVDFTNNFFRLSYASFKRATRFFKTEKGACEYLSQIQNKYR